MSKNRKQVLLKSRPPGEPSPDNFELVENEIPAPGDGEVLVRGIYMSLDPYMRGRMREGKSYVPPTELGTPMPAGVVGEVIDSNSERFAKGDIVEGLLGWQTHGVMPEKELRKVDASLAPISTALGVLGMPGMTAYFGLLDVGLPKEGETVVVSAASGAVGGLVGQIAKIKGCRAVGIAGGPEKCAYVKDELGFDAVIDYKAAQNSKDSDLKAVLKSACPDGIDVYFDNVGGTIPDAVLTQINFRARIAICGMISEYNLEKPDLAPRPTRALLVNRARMEGLIVFDWAKRYPEGMKAMAGWIKDGRIKFREDIRDVGLEGAVDAFLGLLKGDNFGKLVVKIGDEP